MKICETSDNQTIGKYFMKIIRQIYWEFSYENEIFPSKKKNRLTDVKTISPRLACQTVQLNLWLTLWHFVALTSPEKNAVTCLRHQCVTVINPSSEKAQKISSLNFPSARKGKSLSSTINLARNTWRNGKQMEYQFRSMIYDSFRKVVPFVRWEKVCRGMKSENNLLPLTSVCYERINNKKTFPTFRSRGIVFLLETDSRVICINDTSSAAGFSNIYLLSIQRVSFFISPLIVLLFTVSVCSGDL